MRYNTSHHTWPALRRTCAIEVWSLHSPDSFSCLPSTSSVQGAKNQMCLSTSFNKTVLRASCGSNHNSSHSCWTTEAQTKSLRRSGRRRSGSDQHPRHPLRRWWDDSKFQGTCVTHPGAGTARVDGGATFAHLRLDANKQNMDQRSRSWEGQHS